MPNDAKFGLVVGVGLVIAVAVVFFHQDGLPATRLAGEPAAVTPEGGPEREVLSTSNQSPSKEGPTKGQLAARRSGTGGIQHVVQEGDNLFSLAQRYYGDGDRFAEIYKANREQLKNPDKLPPGAVLWIP